MPPKNDYYTILGYVIATGSVLFFMAVGGAIAYGLWMSVLL
jgi:hypothetical protein